MPKPIKHRILKTIRKSALTGKAVWVGHKRSYDTEWRAYKRACHKEYQRMRGWGYAMVRRRKNIMRFLTKLTDSLPILGDIPKEKREAAKSITLIADNDPPKQSDFYDHICEERRQRKNAKEREKRWQEKYGQKNKK
jgi:hypothetical protein